MGTIQIRRTSWDELEGLWQELVKANYHSTYNGMGEMYTGIRTAEAKIENMQHYMEGLPVWAAWDGSRPVGFLFGKAREARLVLYDLFVDRAYRRQGLGRRLVLLAIEESGAREIAAEVNRDNNASQELFRSLNFQRKQTSDWLVLLRNNVGSASDKIE